MAVKHESSERGQALVLIVLAVVALMGFSALAIDGGMLYSERRRAQNAADTAAFAAAMAGLDGQSESLIQSAGMRQALINGFDSGTNNDVAVYHPPVAPYVPSQYVGNSEYYLVVIRTEFEPYFARFVYSGKFENTVWALAKAKPSTSVSPGNAIFATGPHECHGVWFAGNSSSKVEGGHIFSNSDQPASENCASGKKQGSADLTVVNGSIKTVGGFQAPTPPGITFDPGQGITHADSLPAPSITPPDCTGYNSYTWGNRKGNITLEPGYWDKIDVGSSDVVTMTRGIYCIRGDFEVNAQGSISGDGVLINMMRKLNGDPTNIKINGGAGLDLKAAFGEAFTNPDASGRSWSGMLIYMEYENGGQIDIAGNASSQLAGTIYAPGPLASSLKGNKDNGDKKSKCDIQGNSGTFNVYAQLICYDVGISGNGSVSIIYKEENQYHEPPHVQLEQ